MRAKRGEEEPPGPRRPAGAAAAGPGHAPELITKEVAFGNGQIHKGGNTLTIEAVAPAPGFTECFFGLDRLVLHLQ